MDTLSTDLFLLLAFYTLFDVDIAKVRDCFGSNRENTWNMFKHHYVSTLWADSTVINLPNVAAMLVSLWSSETFCALTMVERVLTQQCGIDKPHHVYGSYSTSQLRDAMVRCGKEGRVWLWNSSLVVNCRLLELAMELESMPLVNVHGSLM